MKLLRERVIKPEILDTLPPEAARASLRDLVKLNRYFGGHSALGHALDAAGVGAGDAFTLLDVGSASGDMAAVVLRCFPQARVTCLDYLSAHLAGAAGCHRVAADAFRLPFVEGSFDYTFSSLFLHHFTDEEIVWLLREMRRVSRRAVLAVDLHRHPIAYAFVPATRWIFGWDAVTVHDAPASVAAAFRPDELAALARNAGLLAPRVRSHGLSFRLSLAAAVADR